jgi:hypothetical protein
VQGRRYRSENITPPFIFESRGASMTVTVTASIGVLKCLTTAAVMSAQSAFSARA